MVHESAFVRSRKGLHFFRADLINEFRAFGNRSTACALLLVSAASRLRDTRAADASITGKAGAPGLSSFTHQLP